MSEGLAVHRRRLDEIDEQLIGLLGERFSICRRIALYKHAHGIAMMQSGRVEEVRERYRRRGREASLPGDYVEALFELTIDATCRVEDELMASATRAAQP